MTKQLLLLATLLLPGILLSQATKKVLIIGLDGCRPDAIAAANTPQLDGLVANGLFSPDALNDDITISGPGWSAILCGVWSEKHLVTGNNFNGNNYEDYPSLFKHIEDYNSDLNTASICHWNPINDFIVQDDADFKLNVSSDEAVATQAIDRLSQHDPDVLFLHFDDLDHAGHSFGFSPLVPQYIAAIETADAQIETVIQALQARESYPDEDWIILVSTDHGGLGTSHGGNSLEEQNVFVIASGNSIPQSLISKDSMLQFDQAVNCLGDSAELRFDGENDNIQIGSNPLFNFGSDQDFTIECRVRTSVSGDVAIVGNKDWNTGLNPGFVFSFKFPSGPEWKVNIGDGSNRADLDAGGLVADNEWHTLSVSFDRDGLMRMYQDGVAWDSTDISFIGDINTDEGMFFGTDINGAYDFSGAIAEVRVWNKVVTSQEINDWHCTPLNNDHPDFSQLAGYWKIDEDEGNSQVTDYSTNNNPGTIQAATWTTSDSIVVYDFSQTPRLTDIVPTALTHLCIPIEAVWSLDGQSLITACTPNGVESPGRSSMQPSLEISPNPARNEVRLVLKNLGSTHSGELRIFSSNGIKVQEQEIRSTESMIDISELASGTYFFRFQGEDGKQLASQLVIPSN